MISKSGAPPVPQDPTKAAISPPDDTAKEDIKTAVASGNDEPGNSSLVAPTKKDKAPKPPSSTTLKQDVTQAAEVEQSTKANGVAGSSSGCIQQDGQA